MSDPYVREVIDKLFPPPDTPYALYFTIITLSVICGIITTAIAINKRREGCALWFFLGMMLGPVGILMAMVMPKARIPEKMKECPLCEEIIAIKAVRCPYCKLDLTDPNNV